MRVLPVALLSLAIGGAGGYFAHARFAGARDDSAGACESRVRLDAVACTLSPDQIEHLSARIAPAVVEKLASSGTVAPNPQLAAQLRADDEKLKRKQAAAFAEAARLVDQMIENRSVTPQGLERAHALLRESGQADRSYEIDGRIAAAINRGELTHADAGLAPRMQ